MPAGAAGARVCKEVAVAAEHQRAVPDRDRQRHADAVADIFLEPGPAGEPLGGMDHLRKAVAARVETGPDLAAGRGILGHGHDDRHPGIARGRQRPADQARGLASNQPAG